MLSLFFQSRAHPLKKYSILTRYYNTFDGALNIEKAFFFQDHRKEKEPSDVENKKQGERPCSLSTIKEED
jgi:hypothetical protein